jgi:hypothetical protein
VVYSHKPSQCCVTCLSRVFEGEGIFVGDYRKSQSLATNPSENITLWVIPAPITRLMCRLIIFGKPIEVRLIQKFQSDAAASVHRTLLGAFDCRPLRSTKLGELTNDVLSAHGCPNIQYMRHVREHFSTELALELADMSRVEAQKVSAHIHGIAATSSNHDVKTAMNTYAGVFERNRQIRCFNLVCT